MPQLIAFGNELIRINLSNNHIEASTTRGSSGMIRYSGNAADASLAKMLSLRS